MESRSLLPIPMPKSRYALPLSLQSSYNLILPKNAARYLNQLNCLRRSLVIDCTAVVILREFNRNNCFLESSPEKKESQSYYAPTRERILEAFVALSMQNNLIPLMFSFDCQSFCAFFSSSLVQVKFCLREEKSEAITIKNAQLCSAHVMQKGKVFLPSG